ncbi:DUF6428 family protein [Arenibacter sp. F20364]|uniref:DUF6428 family protein n=1 Tax=Arenibacter sp. F20364 TaxID=2926415 RepID=UPI001FF1EF77|nr:DUF6428 family protein [Arenibacter sp. F20364]MCK0192032.1 DUF6428 family protein [Arenibacter sp. F20364]
MTLSEVKNKLNQLEKIYFQLPNGEMVPNHFHVTEAGKTTKQTDCLAKDQCGIPAEISKKNLSEVQTTNACAPGSGCC